MWAINLSKIQAAIIFKKQYSSEAVSNDITYIIILKLMNDIFI